MFSTDGTNIDSNGTKHDPVALPVHIESQEETVSKKLTARNSNLQLSKVENVLSKKTPMKTTPFSPLDFEMAVV